MIAALYVLTDGPYFGLPDVEPWDANRDARLYAGPYPVVAHPPCERWGRYWNGGPSAKEKRTFGDDGGCFSAALHSLKTWGGVLEHPEGSGAWAWYGITRPSRKGGWTPAGLFVPGGWTCCVDQGYYGHPASKATWLLVVNCETPELKWGKSGKVLSTVAQAATEQERRRAIKTGVCQNLSKRQRKLTPEPFRDLLMSIARTRK